MNYEPGRATDDARGEASCLRPPRPAGASPATVDRFGVPEAAHRRYWEALCAEPRDPCAFAAALEALRGDEGLPDLAREARRLAGLAPKVERSVVDHLAGLGSRVARVSAEAAESIAALRADGAQFVEGLRAVAANLQAAADRLAGLQVAQEPQREPGDADGEGRAP